MCISRGVGVWFDSLTISLCMEKFGDFCEHKSLHDVDRDGRFASYTAT